jgi:hypothetical protein
MFASQANAAKRRTLDFSRSDGFSQIEANFTIKRMRAMSTTITLRENETLSVNKNAVGPDDAQRLIPLCLMKTGFETNERDGVRMPEIGQKCEAGRAGSGPARTGWLRTRSDGLAPDPLGRAGCVERFGAIQALGFVSRFIYYSLILGLRKEFAVGRVAEISIEASIKTSAELNSIREYDKQVYERAFRKYGPRNYDKDGAAINIYSEGCNHTIIEGAMFCMRFVAYSIILKKYCRLENSDIQRLSHEPKLPSIKYAKEYMSHIDAHLMVPKPFSK